MQFHKTPLALAALALCSAMPLAARAATPTPAPFSGSLDVWFKAPANGATVSGVLNAGTSCYANTSGSVAQVAFFMDGAALNTDAMPADGTQCVLDSTKFANGSHTMTATVTGTDGSTRNDVISVNVQNAAPTPTPTTTTPTPTTTTTTTASTPTPAPGSGTLDVWFKAPANGATVAGTLNAGTSCYVNASGTVARVAFKIDSTALNTDTTPSDGMQCVVDTTKVANGSHQLFATAYDGSGNSRTDIISVNVQNPTATPTPTTTTPTPTTTTTVTPTPAPQTGSLDVWFKAPTSGATISGLLNAGASCYANSSGSVAKVAFAIDGTALNTDSTPADGTQCVIDTAKFTNGTHTMTATAYDSSGNTRQDVISVNVQNAVSATPTPTTSTPAPTPTTSATPTPAPGSGALDVWFKAPANGTTISGVLSGGTNCYVNGTGVTKVAFLMDGTALNTDTTMSDGMQCAVDTTKFANGAHTMTATAYDSSGNTRQDVISVNVQNASATPTPATSGAGATTSGAPPSLLFRSGFENAVTANMPTDCYSNGCWQDFSGTDASTGFGWPPNIYGGGTRIQELTAAPQTPTPSTVSNWMSNQIRAGQGRNGSNGLYMQISQSGCCGTASQGGGATQDAFTLMPTSDPTDLYISYWIMLQPDLAAQLASQWRNVFEIKTVDQGSSGPDWRYLLQVVAWNGSTPTWRVRADHYYPSYGAFWDITVPSVPVPIGQWFKLEVFWHRSSGSDGRVWVAVNGEVLDDHLGPNMGAANAPMNRIMITNLYTGGIYPAYQWLDDLQIWDAFPAAKSGDAWYDPPYAAH